MTGWRWLLVTLLYSGVQSMWIGTMFWVGADPLGGWAECVYWAFPFTMIQVVYEEWEDYQLARQYPKRGK